MNTKSLRYAAFAGAALASLGWSQETIHLAQAPPGAMPTVFTGAPPSFRVMGVGGIEGKTVTGAPYSAEEVTQTIQMLADGNRIVNTSKSKIYRDPQGRRRVEQTVGNIGALSAAIPQTIITIEDPVASIYYNLHPDTRTAEKMDTSGRSFMLKQDVEVMSSRARETPGVRAEGGLPADRLASETIELMIKRQAEASAIETKAHSAGPAVHEGAVYSYVRATSMDVAHSNEESLGTQTMEGVQVQGKRSTVTIPAGTMGNERPILIVDERWYSPELQMNIMTKHSDPRMGETVFTVTNVSRANPDASLFQLPPDYQVVTSSKNMFYKVTKSTNP